MPKRDERRWHGRSGRYRGAVDGHRLAPEACSAQLRRPPEPARERPRHPLSGWVAGIGVTVGIAVLLFVVYSPSFVNYDAQ